MKNFLLILTMLTTFNSLAGYRNIYCTGILENGSTIHFDEEDFTKISKANDFSPKRVTTMKVVLAGDLYYKGSFELKGYPYQTGNITGIEQIKYKSTIDGGEECNGGHTPYFYKDFYTLKASYLDFETKEQTIILNCTEQGAKAGTCYYE